MDLHWNAGFADASAACPAITWAGNVEIDGTMYGMTFVPTGGRDTGKASHFVEEWAIYDAPFEFAGGVLEVCAPGEVVLAGHDFGVLGPNDKYRMNGMVSTAEGAFEDWMGARVHMAGLILWTAEGWPEAAPGMLRLN